MAFTMTNLHGGMITVLVLLALATGCKKNDAGVSPDNLPDLNSQARPYLTIENTKLRSGPGPQFRAIADIPANAKVHIVGRDGDWALLISKKGNPPGFVELAAIKPGESENDKPDYSAPRRVEGKFTVVSDTQVRSGPGLHFPSLADIASGTEINVVGEEKGWLKVESRRGNKPGYVDITLAKPLGDK